MGGRVRFRIPHQLKVGGLLYDVERPKLRGGRDWDGRNVPSDLLIQIPAEMNPELAEAAFVHELLHALDIFAVLGLSDNQVERLAQALMMVLANNEILEVEA